MGTLHYFTNHKLLILINIAYLCLYFSNENKMTEKEFFKVIQIQLLLVYWFAAISKIHNDFYTGESLSNLLKLIGYSPYSIILSKKYLLLWSELLVLNKYLSIVTLLIQFLLPLLLFWKFNLGLFLLVCFHFSFCLVFPGLYPFAFIMISMSISFYKEVASLSPSSIFK